MVSQSFTSSIIVLLVVLCALMPRTAHCFWVAPMWGNKLDSVQYSQGNNQVNKADESGSYDNDMVGESSAVYMKYPGWVSRKQGMPFTNSFGKRYDGKSVWSILFECSVDSSKCLQGRRRQNTV